ncbi:unnamed protein product [Rangifer tarandus platyrhynchus]|uniref:Uncharacterized protein n=1 Tax=Rangifer tarandus platyrhynchus TaxID=3082113 RepID=A0ABN8ZKQ1_RANTA|nr:unnamed protein product [Rangifer tarandus platyrhynchus]
MWADLVSPWAPVSLILQYQGSRPTWGRGKACHKQPEVSSDEQRRKRKGRAVSLETLVRSLPHLAPDVEGPRLTRNFSPRLQPQGGEGGARATAITIPRSVRTSLRAPARRQVLCWACGRGSPAGWQPGLLQQTCLLASVVTIASGLTEQVVNSRPVQRRGMPSGPPTPAPAFLPNCCTSSTSRPALEVPA